MQLANFQPRLETTRQQWAFQREAQLKGLELPKTGVAIATPRCSNHNDLDPLRLHPEVDFTWLAPGQALPPCDLVILPGSKAVQADLAWLREDPKRIVNASEEFFRAISPVTHIARVCPAHTEVHGVPVEAGERISLCFASANHDETVFKAPDEVRLDRKPNPHVAFGFGPHLCLGAAHARLVVRTLMRCLCEQVSRIETLAAEEKVERETRYNRPLSFDSLTVRFVGPSS